MSGSPQRQRVDEPLTAGEILVDRFRVVRRIAQGGMGVVYEAYDEKLGRRIALKCARPGQGGHLSPEVRLATEVSHVNICKIYEIHTAQTPDGPLDFFTMEFLEGQTLSHRLREGPLRPEEMEAIARQICAGLAEAHQCHIIHGDLKSPNVILSKNSDGTLRAVITDFGLARSEWNLRTSGGTEGYMAPELYEGAPTTVASDIYALGAMLHELVCGYLPYERAAMLAPTVTQKPEETPASDRRQQVAALSHNQPLPLKSRWDPIIAKCLQRDPTQRYENVAQIVQALGPSLLRRRILMLAGTLAFAAIAALGTYYRSTAPAETVRLDVAAVRSAPELAAQARQLHDAASEEIGRIKNSAEIAFYVRTSRPTHTLAAELTPKGGKITLRAVLREVRSGVAVKEWSGDYEPAQLRYAPVAVAGLVSSAFHLPPPGTYATVSAVAAAPYDHGISLLQDDSKLDGAFAALQSAATLDPDSALPFAALAEAQRRRFVLTTQEAWKNQALVSLEQAELRNPDCAEVHRIAGLLEFDRNRQEQAIARELRATEFRPPHPDAFRRLGQMYQWNGEIPKALQAFSEAQRLAPRDVRIYQDLAYLYNKESNFVEAAKALQTAVELAPDRPGLRRRLAATYQDEGRFAEAEAEFRKALEQDKSADTLLQFGHLLMYQKRDREALPLLVEAAGGSGSNPFACLYLGLACQRTGRVSDARKAFQRGLSAIEKQVIQQPRSGANRAMLAYFCVQVGQAERAAIEAAQAVQLAPHHNDTLWWAALTYERTGNRDAALKTLEGAPRPLLEDLQRWPEAATLTADPRFVALLQAVRTR
jgi:tetratricopeptide (TPR) repeat protein/tRNA A-37 threonylcarbamoyl transferase component Bud32